MMERYVTMKFSNAHTKSFGQAAVLLTWGLVAGIAVSVLLVMLM
jgi:hypothetical protein